MVRRLALLLALLLPCALAQNPAEPLTYRDVLRLVEQAPAVEDARRQLEEAEKNLAEARSPIQASAALSTSGSVRFAGGGPELPGAEQQSGGSDASASATLSGNAALGVFPYGTAADAATRAEYAVQRAELQLADRVQQTRTEAVALFTTAVRNEQQLRLLEGAVELAELQLEATEARFAAGAESEAQVLQANIAVTSAANDLASSRGEATATLTDLGQLLGVPVAAVAPNPPYETLDDLPEPPLELDSAQLLQPVIASAARFADRLELRRDVQEAQLAVLEAQLDLRAAAREDEPRLDLDVDFTGRDGPTTVQVGVGFDTNSWNPSAAGSVSVGSGQEGSQSSLSLSASLTVPLGSTGEGPAASARRALERAQENLVRVRESATVQVEASLRRPSSAWAQAQRACDLVKQARLSLERSEAQYESGVISIIELIQARRSFEEARLQAGRSLDNYLAALFSAASELAIDPTEVMT